MKLIKAIFNHFRTEKKEQDRTDCSAFFNSEGASNLIHALNLNQLHPKGISSIQSSALRMAQTSHAEYIIITQLLPDQSLKVEAISDCENPITLDRNLQFKTKIAADIFTNEIVHSSDPEEILSQLNITRHKAKSVTAMLLYDNEHIPLGIVFHFSKSKNNNKPLTLNALQFFSFNISSELVHLINKEKLEKKNRDLLRTEEELQLKNQLLDNLNQSISKAKQVVDESSRLKSAFLANLSHEIRTPMNVIMGFTELLSADSMSSEQRRNYIDIIQQNGTRLLNIMDSLIDISRFQAKNIGKEQQAFSLNQMMHQLYNNYQSEIEVTGKPLTLTLKLAASGGNDVVTLDKEATYKVLNHILDNAVKFTASGFVHFGYQITDKQVSFYVEDSGMGIPDGKEKEIFDLFRQGDLRLSRQFGGTGLGLAIAKRYVNAMNGQIWCSNNKNSAGATFRFTLPHKTDNQKIENTRKEPNSRGNSQLLFSVTSNRANN